MTLEGDLSTLDLADLFQSLEQNRRTGTLTVRSDEHEVAVFFRKGRISLYGFEGRPALGEVLVDAGSISAETLARVTKRRHKSLVRALAKARAISAEQVEALAAARLVDEVCGLIHSRVGAFRFEEGGVPSGPFDAEERDLQLGLDVGPLLLEAARRSDHWALIRECVPSDWAHYVLERRPDASAAEDPELATTLADRLDGTRSVAEAVAVFPHRRFDAYLLLAEWVGRRHARLARAEDLVSMARETAETDRRRAREIIEHGLDVHPQHAGLLRESAAMAQDLGEVDDAVDALKMLAHLTAESGDGVEARETLERALGLKPDDAALWERALQLDLDAGDEERALRDGAHLTDLYRKPGRTRKALGVLERLLEVAPGDVRLHTEHAQALAECGEERDATNALSEFGRRCLRERDEAKARAAFEALLDIDPDNAGARQILSDLENQVFAKRRARRRELFRRAVTFLLFLVVCAAGWVEWRARMAVSEAEREIGQQYWIEEGRYGQAIEALEAVRSAHPLALATRVELDRHIADLIAKETEPRPASNDEPRAEQPAPAQESPANETDRTESLPELAPEATFVPAPADAEALEQR